MTTRPQRLSALLVAALVSLALATAGGLRAGQAELPYRLGLHVAYGEPLGPESLRADLEAELLAAVAARGCFRSVERFAEERPDAHDVLLLLRLDEFSDELEYDMSLASRNSPTGGANADRQRVARVEVTVSMELRAGIRSAPLRDKRFRQQSSWRPLNFDDPSLRARTALVDGIVRSARSFACKGSPKKWARDLERSDVPSR